MDTRNDIDAKWERLLAGAGRKYPLIYYSLGYVSPYAALDLINRGDNSGVRTIGLLASRANVDCLRANLLLSEQAWNNMILNDDDIA